MGPNLPPYYLNSEECPLTDKVVITDDIEIARNIHKIAPVTCLYIDVNLMKNSKNIMVLVHNIIRIFENNCKEYYLAVSKDNIMSILPFLCLDIKILEIRNSGKEEPQKERRSRLYSRRARVSDGLSLFNEVSSKKEDKKY